MKLIYAVSALFGIALIAYAYGVHFDSMSETELLRLGPLWVLPLAYGLYGLAAEKVLDLMEKGHADSLSMATMLIVRQTSILGGFFLAPFFLLSSKKSQLVALVAVGCWYGVYFLFTAILWSAL